MTKSLAPYISWKFEFRLQIWILHWCFYLLLVFSCFFSIFLACSYKSDFVLIQENTNRKITISLVINRQKTFWTTFHVPVSNMFHLDNLVKFLIALMTQLMLFVTSINGFFFKRENLIAAPDLTNMHQLLFRPHRQVASQIRFSWHKWTPRPALILAVLAHRHKLSAWRRRRVDFGGARGRVAPPSGEI